MNLLLFTGNGDQPFPYVESVCLDVLTNDADDEKTTKSSGPQTFYCFYSKVLGTGKNKMFPGLMGFCLGEPHPVN